VSGESRTPALQLSGWDNGVGAMSDLHYTCYIVNSLAVSNQKQSEMHTSPQKGGDEEY
jgi:hypothetical protein